MKLGLGLLALGLLLSTTAVQPSHRSVHQREARFAGWRTPAVRDPTVRTEAPGEVAIIDDLADCSPFFSFSGDQQLDFDPDGVTETVDSPAAHAGFEGDASATYVGTFDAAEDTRRVRIKIAGSAREYTLVIPADGAQCILAVGNASAADLQQSWYGTISDDPEPHRSDVQRASFR